MKTTQNLWSMALRPTAILLWVFLSADPLGAAVRYVNVTGANPMPPYDTWATAARNIQDAIDEAVAGDEVVVTNGVYQTGGRVVDGAMTNRVAVSKPLSVRSVNGPEATVIRGYQVPGTTNGDGAVRCVYLAEGAALVGFTLTNGATLLSGDDPRHTGGGVWCASAGAVLSNCVLTGNSAYSAGGGASGGTLNNCTLAGNSADNGGGAYLATLNNCTLTANSARQGGGVSGFYSSLRHFRRHPCMLYNCTVTGNSATHGGGGNVADYFNCIVQLNHAPVDANYSDAFFEYSCTTPLPPGEGNIDADPQLASATHLSPSSPCRGAGSTAYATGLDIDGEPWANPPSIGCDEYHPGAVTGPLSVAIVSSDTTVVVGIAVNFTVQIIGWTSLSRWEFGDGTAATNRPFTTHSWAGPGGYPVVLWAYNETYPEGVSATVTVHVVEPPVHYVAADSSNPVAPYSSWGTAATNIQDAVDAASVAGAVVLVTNGVYQTGGRVVDGAMTNRVAVTKPLTVRSVNGPEVTVIRGYQVPGTRNGDEAVRCVYLAGGAMLMGFTLTNGATRTIGDAFLERSGGGVWCASTNAVVTACVLSENVAEYGGGGAYGGTLNNCVLDRNAAIGPIGSGGGAYASTMNHCTLTENSAGYRGGGTFSALLNHSTLTGNLASYSGGAASEGTLNNCTLGENSAEYGGGAFFAVLNRCTLAGNGAESGGGSYGGLLNNCILKGNSAESGGGGAYDGTLNNCTLTGNSAEYGGGAAYGGGIFYSITLNNCIVYFNTARSSEANYQMSAGRGRTFLTHCCTTPVASDDVGSFTNAPLFVDQAGGNLRLQSNSPCINAGLNAYAPAGVDLDGNPRIVGSTVDVGAYEFQSPQSTISYAWLLGYGLPTDGSADSTDPDGDGMTNWQEWRAGTNPNDPLSLLRLLPPVPLGPDLFVSWQSAAGVSYFLERSTNLTSPALFTPLATNLNGLPGIMTYADANTAGLPGLFYRVGVTATEAFRETASEVATGRISASTALGLQAAMTAPTRRPDVMYVTTPDAVVDAMLKAANVTTQDLIYDLGCGDGRIVVTAAKNYGARGIGIDIDPQRVKEVRENVQRNGVGDRVEIRQEDLFQHDFRDASVVTLYLLPSLNLKLRPKLWKELRVGTRVVSHAFDMGEDWKPEQQLDVDGRRVYLWTITEDVKRRAD